MGHGPRRLAVSNYRGIKVTLTQGSRGTYVWDVWTKAGDRHWSNWQVIASGEVVKAPQITSTKGALSLLLNVLDTELAVLSQRDRDRDAERPGTP